MEIPEIEVQKPRKEREKYFLYLAIPLILLSLTFWLASGVSRDNLKFYLEGGYVGAAIYYRDLAEQLMFNSILLIVIALILLTIGIIMYYLKEEEY